MLLGKPNILVLRHKHGIYRFQPRFNLPRNVAANRIYGWKPITNIQHPWNCIPVDGRGNHFSHKTCDGWYSRQIIGQITLLINWQNQFVSSPVVYIRIANNFNSLSIRFAIFIPKEKPVIDSSDNRIWWELHIKRSLCSDRRGIGLAAKVCRLMVVGSSLKHVIVNCFADNLGRPRNITSF